MPGQLITGREKSLMCSCRISFQNSITTYTYTLSYADRDDLKLNGAIIQHQWHQKQLCVSAELLQRNIYKTTHAIGPGVRKIVVQDPNRNADVINIRIQ